jgi:drug/metabolite transporter (DMT)-like permease
MPFRSTTPDTMCSQSTEQSKGGLERAWSNPYLLLAAVALFWAGNSIVGRAVRDTIPPFTLALGRWVGALLILLPFAWARLRIDRSRLLRHWKQTLLLGALGVGAFNALLYSGLHFTTATNGLLIQSAMPAVILLLNYLLYREAAGGGQVLAVLVSMIGVIVILARGSLETLARLQVGVGDALVFGAVIAWSLYTVLLRVRPPGPSPQLPGSDVRDRRAGDVAAQRARVGAGIAAGLAIGQPGRFRLRGDLSLADRLYPVQSGRRTDRRRARWPAHQHDAAVRRRSRDPAAG